MTPDSVTENTAHRPKTTGGEDVAVVLITRAGLIIAGLAIQSLLAYTLLPEGRGAYAVCVIFGGLFGALFSPGADRGAQYFVMKKQISLSQGVSVALSICLLGSALASAIAIPLIRSDISFFQKADPRSFHVALVLIPLTSFSTSMQLQLAGLRRFARLAFFSLLQTAVNVLTVVILVWGLGFGVDGALIAGAVSHLVMIFASAWDLRRDHGLRLVIPGRSSFIRVLRYGLEYYVARMGQLVDVKVGSLFLGMIAARIDIGLFAVASGLMMRVFIISNSVSSALLPRVTEDASGRPGLVAFCARVTSWATGLAVAVLLAFMVPLTRVLLSEAFLPIVPLIWVIAPGVFVYGGASVLMAYFRGINRPRVCSWVVWSGLSANLTTVALLYPRLGVVAAAWGMTVGGIVRSAVLSTVYWKTTHMTLASIWLPQGSDAKRIWALWRGAVERGLGRRPVDG